MKRRIKESDNKVTQMAKRGKERENHKTTTSQTQMPKKKMENKEDAIEVNKITRHQMRRLMPFHW